MKPSPVRNALEIDATSAASFYRYLRFRKTHVRVDEEREKKRHENDGATDGGEEEKSGEKKKN